MTSLITTGFGDFGDCCGADGIALDVEGGQMYLSRPFDIWQANLDGPGVTKLIVEAGPGGSTDIALDVERGQIYWTDVFFGIQRANFDGSGVTKLGPVVVPGQEDPLTRSIALDLDAGHIYLISNIPLPPSLWLFTSALVSIGFVGHRSRRAA